VFFNEVKYWEVKRASNKKEFRTDTIRAHFKKDVILFEHIRFDTFNGQDVQTEVGFSEWEVLKSGLKHVSGKKWYPDGEHQDTIFAMVESLHKGQLGPDAANHWITEFFAHLEVGILGENSVFAECFPEFFKVNNNNIKRVRDRIVKTIINT